MNTEREKHLPGEGLEEILEKAERVRVRREVLRGVLEPAGETFPIGGLSTS